MAPGDPVIGRLWLLGFFFFFFGDNAPRKQSAGGALRPLEALAGLPCLYLGF